MLNVGLVLEGGGMRGAYSAGVLEVFLENNIDFKYVIGVSAGASCGASYVAGQKGRNKIVFVDRPGDKDAAGLKYYFKGQGYLNMEHIYHEIPNDINPLDYDAIRDSDKMFKICMTDAETGDAVYVDKDDIKDRSNDYINYTLQASSSLPIITAPTELDGNYYYDGGTVDSIPIRKSIEDGNKYNVVVLTRPIEYRKDKQILGPFRLYLKKRFPKILEKLDVRHEMYNSTVEFILEEEKEGRAFVFRPVRPFDVNRLETDVDKLEDLYNQGYEETTDKLDDFRAWLKKINK